MPNKTMLASHSEGSVCLALATPSNHNEQPCLATRIKGGGCTPADREGWLFTQTNTFRILRIGSCIRTVFGMPSSWPLPVHRPAPTSRLDAACACGIGPPLWIGGCPDWGVCLDLSFHRGGLILVALWSDPRKKSSSATNCWVAHGVAIET